MPEYENFTAFCQTVVQHLPDEWNIQFNPASDATSNEDGGGAGGFRRDDLVSVTMSYPTTEEWPPENILVSVAQDAKTIPDRPNANVERTQIPPSDASKVAQFIHTEAPEYTGTFEYDDE